MKKILFLCMMLWAGCASAQVFVHHTPVEPNYGSQSQTCKISVYYYNSRVGDWEKFRAELTIQGRTMKITQIQDRSMGYLAWRRVSGAILQPLGTLDDLRQYFTHSAYIQGLGTVYVEV